MSETRRPDPDALLASQGAGRRGRLKVYLGMAAGVGKTYAMLHDAQEARARGEDVVLGYLEPHGRKETERMADGMERLTLREVTEKGMVLREVDVDAALVRRPARILVDELAHSNAPGSRHRKRWQDVQELRDAGIDVDTTVNVQHLESLNDVVAQITGVIVRETVPDAVLDSADEVELIDIPPDDLRRRLEEGKVYPSERVPGALGGFFKKGNLLALRELALRRAAEQVDEQVRIHRAATGARDTWAARERIVVCVSANEAAERVVRAARRMATAQHADLLAVWVDSARETALPEARRVLAMNALRLAESLGARTSVLTDTDAAAGVVRFAQEHNATTLVVGRPLRPRWREILFGSVVDSIVRRSGAIDVHVVTEPLGDKPAPSSSRETAWDPKGFAEAIGAVAIVTLAGLPMRDRVAPTNLAMVYLGAVVWTAGRRSPAAAVVAAVSGVVAFDLLFVPPYGTFAISDAQYGLTFAVMLAIGLLISGLTGRLRRQSDASVKRERRTAALYDLSRQLARSRKRRDLGAATVKKVHELTDRDAAVFGRSRADGSLFVAAGSDSGFEDGRGERAVAQYVLERGKPAGAGTDTLPGADGTYLPLAAERGVVGVLAVGRAPDAAEDPETRGLLETVANLLAVAMERANLAKDRVETRLAADQERLRSALLASVSHDLRTPLAVIRGSAESLALRQADPESERLARTIANEADRLARRVHDLLQMTRLENGGDVSLRMEWQSVEEIVGSAASKADSWLGDRALTVKLSPDLPLVWADGMLLEQALLNLLENATHHTPLKTRVEITARATTEEIRLEVGNDGPELKPGEAERVFGRGERGSDAVEGGFGLGLAIVHSIMAVHGGRALAYNRPEGGVSFMLQFPRTEAPATPVE